MRAKFADGWWRLDFDHDEALFYHLLPTAEERKAAFLLYPAECYSLAGFEDWDFYRYRAVKGHGFPYRRENFAKWLEEHPPRAEFTMPDLRGVPYRAIERVLCEARRQWWRQNGWPETAEERAWQPADPAAAPAAAEEPERKVVALRRPV